MGGGDWLEAAQKKNTPGETSTGRGATEVDKKISASQTDGVSIDNPTANESNGRPLTKRELMQQRIDKVGKRNIGHEEQKTKDEVPANVETKEHTEVNRQGVAD